MPSPSIQPISGGSGVVTIPATIEPFIAADHFTKEPTVIWRWFRKKIVLPPSVSFKWFSLPFERFMKDRGRRVMWEASKEWALQYVTLEVDGDISTIVWGKEKERQAATNLWVIWNLLKQQPNGEQGPLLTDGRQNVFLVYDDYYGRTNAIVVHFEGRTKPSGWEMDVKVDRGSDHWHNNCIRVFVPQNAQLPCFDPHSYGRLQVIP